MVSIPVNRPGALVGSLNEQSQLIVAALTAVRGNTRCVVNFQPASYAEGSVLMLLAARRIAGPHLGDLWLLPCLSLTHIIVILLRPALRLLAAVVFMMHRILLVTLRIL
jgi:hypothetical protein